MTKDDITQKLALLPGGVTEGNLHSWEDVALFYKGFIDNPLGDTLPDNFYDKVFPVLYKLVNDFSKTEQAKLYRAGQSVYDLMISTADKHGLKSGEPFVRIFFRGEVLIIQYEINGPITGDENLNVYERKSCRLENDLMSILQPMLNRLWDETRGKKNV